MDVRIDKLVYGGTGLGRHEGKVVFAPFTVPGDLVRVRVVAGKKNFLRAEVIEILEPGPGRRMPPCPYFGRCGGCQWQHLEYERQLEAKRQILEGILHHHVPDCRGLVVTMRGSPRDFGYRSRARVQLRGFGEAARVGFYRFQTHQVEDVETCALFSPALDTALGVLRQSRRDGAGVSLGADQVEVAASGPDGTWAAVPVTGSEDESLLEARLPESDSSDEPVLRHRIGELEYRFSPSVFFQANDTLAPALVEAVSTLSIGAGTAAALDLFAGVGLFTLPLARQFGKVTAVERSSRAARFCRENAHRAGLTNVSVFGADALDWMGAASGLGPPGFDLVVLDPPRSGAGAEVMAKLVEWTPPVVIYVACDPNTLARDLASVARHYRVDHAEGFDLFPQTYHFETIVRLVRR